MEIIGLIISFAAIFLALFTYFKHDRKIKEQSKILNEYNIEKINKEKEEAQKAIIEANVISKDRGTIIIKVYNKGRSTAKSVIITLPDIKGFSVFKNPSPIDIRPQNSVEVKLAINLECSDKIDITFEWSDNYKEVNKEIQMIQL